MTTIIEIVYRRIIEIETWNWKCVLPKCGSNSKHSKYKLLKLEASNATLHNYVEISHWKTIQTRHKYLKWHLIGHFKSQMHCFIQQGNINGGKFYLKDINKLMKQKRCIGHKQLWHMREYAFHSLFFLVHIEQANIKC